jgi:hypothetical protein
MRIAMTMTNEEKEMADSLDTIRSHTEELIRGACLLLEASHTEASTAWATLASAKSGYAMVCYCYSPSIADDITHYVCLKTSETGSVRRF